MARKTFFLTIYFVIGLVAYATAYPDAILFKKYAQQAPFCDSVYENTIEPLDSAAALTKLKDLEQWADRKGDDQLKCYFRMLKYRYSFNKLNLSNDRVMQEALAFDEELERYDTPLLRADIISLITMRYWADKKYALAFENGINAY